jgi:L-threonylcarbamoyladenylate synthase
MKQVFLWNIKGNREHLLRLLQSKKVLVGDSDTVCGLFALTTLQGKKLLDRIKQRSHKPYLLLVSSVDKACAYFDPSVRVLVKKLGGRYWPGPLTIVGKAATHVPSYITLGSTIALRVPDHKGLHTILEHVPALFSTSANITDESVPASIEEINPEVIAQTSAIVRDEFPTQKEPSTIVELVGNQVRMVRPGIYSLQELQKALTTE